ncbi:hypothetical protein [Bradyrhizobium sp. DOA1]|uniref:hypothetical protein n=1 Tax=Bradyrhizobium sp. DOA1 TaxID=1126616 RepID=UPI00077CB7D5|nr:hypothetical protein [Bradyrhizobium sp. DOA1]KYH01142.1 hypothetical protein SE91_23850 [Bradyrhizobium sp. DOA1]
MEADEHTKDVRHQLLRSSSTLLPVEQDDVTLVVVDEVEDTELAQLPESMLTPVAAACGPG